MIVKLLTEVARGRSVLPRGLHDLPDALASEFMRHGWAEAIEEPQPEIETAAEYLQQPRGRKDARIKTTRRPEGSGRLNG